MTIDGAELAAEVRALVQQASYAAVSTLLHSGQPQTQLTWIDADDTYLLVNTLPFAHKFRNASRDPRVTVLVIDRNDREHYAEIRGHVVGTLEGQAAVEHVDRLAYRYSGAGYHGPAQRVVLQIQPFRQLIRRNPWR